MEKTKKDTEYFSVVQGVQAKVMLYISYKETCHIFFKHTVKPDDDQPIVLLTAPTGSAAFQIGGPQSILHFYYMIIINPNQVGRREVKCKSN